MTEQLYTVNAACALLGVSRRTLYQWIQKGKLRGVRTAGGSWRFTRAQLFPAYQGCQVAECEGRPTLAQLEEATG